MQTEQIYQMLKQLGKERLLPISENRLKYILDELTKNQEKENKEHYSSYSKK